ncbi:IclR family transcriptional regulator [Haloechinothrix halophila]|uniref:IclR family transcriptional regulator n=1 Tax=Haloechinothrix halophila TaxID=1069073 RepID=UPI0009FC0FA1|nr:IclR family transcriptional regulator [Haloechinothrix halophila]
MRTAQRNNSGPAGTASPEPPRVAAADPSTAARLTALLAAFRPGDDAIGVSELARRTGLPKTSVHRLSGHLVEHGLLEREGPALRLGLKLFEIGQLAVRQRGLVDTARPLLADLREATHNTVHLAILEGTEVVYLDVVRGPDAPRLPSRIGGRFPAHATGVGKAILAFSPDDVIDAVIDAGLPRISRRTITSPALLRRQLTTIAADGAAYEHEESSIGTVCVASPVVAADGRAVAAISVAGWVNRMRTERLAPAVRTAALTLSRTVR